MGKAAPNANGNGSGTAVESPKSVGEEVDSTRNGASSQGRRAGRSSNPDRPVVVRSRRRWLWAVVAALAAGALFAAGLFAANLMRDDEPDLIDATTQGLALQQLVQLSEAADQVVADARDVTDIEQLQDAGIQLQAIAVSVDGLAGQIPDEELRDAVQRLADGYLGISVGLVVNNGAWTIDGAETLNAAKDDLLILLNIEPSAPPQE